MIVRNSGSVQHLITQPDHAALAGRIMRLWRPLHDSPRRGSILHAIEEHDNGWQEPDAAPSIDPANGAIYDFVNLPAEARQAVWPRGIARLSHDPWAAALVAQHAWTVYDRYRPDAAWEPFFATIRSMRDSLVRDTGRPLQQLEEDYSFVRIGDLISLMFCNQWDDETFGPWRFRRDGDAVHVTPDPFAGSQVPIAITARELPRRRYTSAEDLQDVFREAPAVTLHGTVTGEPMETQAPQRP